MAENTKIEWVDHTFSPWEGCQKVGPGCDHCYAEARNNRFAGGNWGPGAPRRIMSDSYWRVPWRWDREAAEKGERVSAFPSLCDPFDNAAPEGGRERFANLILGTPNIDWLLLTKRIGNVLDMLIEMFPNGVPDNVRIGATIVNQDEADRDLPKVRQVAVACKTKPFLSIEPLLRPIDLAAADPIWARYIGWVIVGGESGANARPMPQSGARSLRDQCANTGVPFLFKQWGEWIWVERIEGPRRYVDCIRPGKKAAGRLLDGVEHNGFPA